MADRLEVIFIQGKFEYKLVTFGFDDNSLSLTQIEYTESLGKEETVIMTFEKDHLPELIKHLNWVLESQ